MSNETYPDPMPNSFSCDNAQGSGKSMPDNITIVGIKSQSAHFTGTGNRCGHKKDTFRDIALPNEANRPKVIQWAMERIRKFFRLPDKYFPDLKELNTQKKNSQDHRLTRSEGRESLMTLCLLLFYNLELASMTVRIDDIVFNSPTFQELTHNGDHLSLSRAYRALRKLVRAGWVKVTRQYEKSKNLYCALASIKEVTPQFFKALKLEKYYAFSQSYKRKILEKRAYKKSRKQQKMQRFDSLLPNREVLFKKATPQTLEIVTHQDIESMRKELILFFIEHSPTVDRNMIVSVVYKYSYDMLKQLLETHRQRKVHDPP